MVVRFNSLDRMDKPKLTLCNPGSVFVDGILTNVVGILNDHEAEEIVFNFNTTSELNFRLNLVRREDAEEDAHAVRLFKAALNRRLVFVDGIGYFMISNVEDQYDNGLRYKDIKAQSIDIELQQKMIPFINDGTYPFRSAGGADGILDIIAQVIPDWEIGYVDSAVAEKWRTFEDVDTSLNCLGFLLDNVQEAYECIVLFDIINRTISVYDQANYVRNTSVHITKDDVINTLDISENADDLYTAISVLGDDNVTIGAVNPLGANTIYDFSYYIDWMSPELGAKVLAWQEAVAAAESSQEAGSYYNLNLDYYVELEHNASLIAESTRLQIQVTMYNRCRDNIVAKSNTSLVDEYNSVIVSYGGTEIVVLEEIADTLAEIDGLIAACEADIANVELQIQASNDALEALSSNISTIRESLRITEYFTQEEYAELSHYIFEGSYTDEYVTITDIMTYAEKFEQMKILYSRAKDRLSKVSQPTQEFKVDTESFIFAKEFEHWTEQLETGCLINVEMDDDDIAPLFLSNMTVNYDDHKISMTFGNRYNKFDPKSLFEDVLGDVSKSANTLNYIKDLVYPIKSGEFDQMQEAIQTSRDLTMGAALTSTNEEVVIDGSGYTGRKLLEDGGYDPRQIKITGRNIVFTDDAWETCKTAIGELVLGDNNSVYGINAEAVIGNIIMGNNLHIIDSNGNDLLDVVDGRITMQVSQVVEDTNALESRVSTLETTADGVNIWIENVNQNGVDKVTTRMGYTFNDEGLHISRDGEEMTNLLDNTGMRVQRSGEDVLVADNAGVNAINLTARQYLIIGSNSRFEDYSNKVDDYRTACFFIGEGGA